MAKITFALVAAFAAWVAAFPEPAPTTLIKRFEGPRHAGQVVEYVAHSRSDHHSGTAPVPHGTAPTPHGTAPVPHGTAPFPTGTAPTPHGTAPVPHGSGR
ncbi:hypothetical protein K470DRAFT_260317 [Piedraia hortae CBS 480.64]|uniref:Uncharacterized protein n=1 Tax=Piedraia hortae CBS 480.64 TaxID=1314780 RepID=A0A6A7BRY5_9PEZI|nr:hypothetical protein K470DRAFT_260317 [Piedraia hortae CBS 480.64]